MQKAQFYFVLLLLLYLTFEFLSAAGLWTLGWRFRRVNTRLGAKPRQPGAPAISEKLACAYASEGGLGCSVMARTRLGSGIARDLKTFRTAVEASFIRKKICDGV